MIIGIDHRYYAIKSRHFSFPSSVTVYAHESYALKNPLQIGGKYFVCGTSRQPILRDKTVNDSYYILILAATAMKGFLNFMARCTSQSTRNLLILYAQNPEITRPLTFDM